jgi:Flp pilus assembly protein TadB
MARQNDELDLEKLRREVDTLTQQVGDKPTPPGTTTRLPLQEKPKKKKKGNPIMYGLIGVAAILVGGKLIFSLMNFLVLAVIAGIGAWWYFFKFRKDED